MPVVTRYGQTVGPQWQVEVSGVLAALPDEVLCRLLGDGDPLPLRSRPRTAADEPSERSAPGGRLAGPGSSADAVVLEVDRQALGVARSGLSEYVRRTEAPWTGWRVDVDAEDALTWMVQCRPDVVAWACTGWLRGPTGAIGVSDPRDGLPGSSEHAEAKTQAALGHARRVVRRLSVRGGPWQRRRLAGATREMLAEVLPVQVSARAVPDETAVAFARALVTVLAPSATATVKGAARVGADGDRAWAAGALSAWWSGLMSGYCLMQGPDGLPCAVMSPARALRYAEAEVGPLEAAAMEQSQQRPGDEDLAALAALQRGTSQPH